MWRVGGRLEHDSCLPDYAVELPVDLYVENPEWFSRLEPKIHQKSQIADDASVQCQIDLLGRENLGAFAGSLNTIAGGASALIFPYTLPKRLALVAYMSEAAIIGDDIEEAVLSATATATSQTVTDSQEATSTQALLVNLDVCINERVEQTIAKVMALLLEHGELGELTFSSWDPSKRIEQIVKSKMKHTEYRDLKHYLSARREDFGWRQLISLAHFGAGIILDAPAKSIADSILEPLFNSAILSNDYHSWKKESALHTKRLMNSVALFMQWDSLSERDARETAKRKTMEFEKDYLTQKEEYLHKNENKLSQNVLGSLELVEAIVAGLSLWNMSCPRYQPSVENQYLKYFQDRVADGFRFFDNSTESRRIIWDEPGSLNSGAQKDALNQVVANGRDEYVQSTTIETSVPVYFGDTALDPLGLQVLRQPSDYIMAMPGKGVRGAVLNAINLWYKVPQASLDKIKSLVKLTHTCSLMFDDVQDNSPLRRGQPSAHTIFGVGQTISSGFFLCLDAFKLAQSLSPPAMSIYLDELDSMHRGQAYDLYWTRNSIVPTEKEYLSMIDAKTSALFRLATRLSRAEATANKQVQLELERHFTVVGRYFQIRDDYQNLMSSEYTDSKGFCEDLDEGKYSLLLIHSLQKGDPLIQSILQQRKIHGSMTMEMKRLVLERLTANGSFDYTLSVIKELYGLVEKGLEALERETNTKNWILWRVLHQLRVSS